MLKSFIAEKIIKRMYRQPINNSYSYKFCEDLSTGYSFILSENDKTKDFFTLEPSKCLIANLLQATGHHDLDYKIEQTINMAMHSILMYGHAFIYLHPHYVQQESDDAIEAPAKQHIFSLDIGEIKGVIQQRKGDKCIFYGIGYNGCITESELWTDGLISLDIKELGYKKKYFSNLLKKLGKCDVISSGLLTSEDADGYDYNTHSKKKRLAFLKLTKSIGWTFGNDDLSDSYILYRKILLDKFRIKALNYIVSKINEGFSICLHNESPGTLVAHIRKLDYDSLWAKYIKGEITVTELTNLLYKKH